MVSCDMCSKTATTQARIEGALMNVCANCATFGTEIKPVLHKSKPVSSLKAEAPSAVLVIDAGQRLRKARQKMGLNEKDAAMKLNIRESTLLHLEANKILPDDATIKKLEKFYAITLLEKIE